MKEETVIKNEWILEVVQGSSLFVFHGYLSMCFKEKEKLLKFLN